MTFGQYERLSLFLTTALSIFLIITTEEVAFWAWGSAGVALLIRAWLEFDHRGPLMPKGTVAAFFVFGFAFVDYFAIAPDILIAGVDAVLLLLSAKLLGPRTVRDNLQIIGLGFLLVLGSTVLSASAWFGIIFLTYMFSGLWALLMQNLRAQWEETGNELRILQQKKGMLGRAFGVAVFGLGIGILLFTLTFYFLFPRVGIRWWSMSLGRQQAVSGFSSEVNLNDIARIQQNPAVALRVKYPYGLPDARENSRLIRGVHLDTYENGRWIDSGKAYAENVFRAGRDHWVLGAGLGKEVVEIFPEDEYAEQLFLPAGSLSVRGQFQKMVRTESRNLSIDRPAGVRSNYEVRFSSEATDATLPTPNHLAVPEQLREYLNHILSEWNLNGAPPGQLTQGLISRLHAEYSYTLSLVPADGSEPVRNFLETSKTGHCELFASSYALLLRTAGIPTRVVNGFAGGEKWNEDTIVYRELHAHSWVEVWLPHEGWTVFDPTPIAAAPFSMRMQLLRSLYRIVDRFRFFWGEWFISYDLRRQIGLATDLRDASQRIGRTLNPRRFGALPDGFADGFKASAPFAAGAVILSAGAILWIRRKQAPRRGIQRKRLQKLYAKSLQRAERLQARKQGQTPLHFARSLSDQNTELMPFVEYTEVYYRLRFGNGTATPEEGMLFLSLHARMRNILRKQKR